MQIVSTLTKMSDEIRNIITKVFCLPTCILFLKPDQTSLTRETINPT